MEKLWKQLKDQWLPGVRSGQRRRNESAKHRFLWQ